MYAIAFVFQASISRYFCQSCGHVSRCHGVVVPRGSTSRSCSGRSWINLARIENHQNQQVLALGIRFCSLWKDFTVTTNLSQHAHGYV